MEFVLTECKTHILGVMIDDKLNWKEHIKMIKSKISKTTAIIYKASHVYIILQRFISTSDLKVVIMNNVQVFKIQLYVFFKEKCILMI